MTKHVMFVIDNDTVTKAVQADEFSLEQLQAGVGGGYIELLPGWKTFEHDGKHHRGLAFADEDVRRKRLPYNDLAVQCWEFAAPRYVQPLVGPVIFVTPAPSHCPGRIHLTPFGSTA